MDQLKLENRLATLEANCSRIPSIEDKLDKIGSRLYLISGGMGLAAYLLSLVVGKYL